MSCKCKESFSIPKKHSIIHFICKIPELQNKCTLFFSNLQIKYEKIENILSIKITNAHKFFEEHYVLLKKSFNDLEKEEIKIFIENKDFPLTISTILYAKPMNKYLNFLEDKNFYDILENESLTSYFQPIIDTNSNNIYAYEMLVRGVLEDGTLMYPNELFTKSSRNDTNFKLDKLCRESALKTAAIKKVNSKVFINFLPTTIYDPKFCLSSTVKWAKQLELNPKNIVFEVVETENVKDKRHLISILNYYRQEGFMIALDDVGEGYSTLNMIIDIKPDIVKVDKNIIHNIHKHELKQSIYKALKTITHENDIKLLAEGIESKKELECVKKIGVDYAQGYYFAKPNPEPIRKIK